MTMPSSTSQSPFAAFLGSTTSSSGPLIDDGAFMNRIGSSGMGLPVSSAWSR
jgi:hypothetical protein